jgi:hypothetical protein
MPASIRIRLGFVLACGLFLAECGGGTTSQSVVATTIALNSGSGQTGVVGTALTNPISVKVTGNGGAPASGTVVTFNIIAGGGSLLPASATSNAQGIAGVSWTLGPTAGVNNNSVTASVGGLTGSPVTFIATATAPVSQFNITLNFVHHGTAAEDAAFAAAVVRWQQLIVGDLPDVTVNIPAGTCFPAQPVVTNQLVDDLLIFVDLIPIDGVGQILGQASPCFVRVGSHLTIVGFMQFDTADLPGLSANGTLNEVILHEMGHVLGFGTIWNLFGLLDTTSTSIPFFSGSSARAQFQALGGAVYLGTPVPVEDSGGVGTAHSHWRERNMHTELMTGFISGPGNPLSTITLGQFQDMGYAVSLAGADPYSGITAMSTRSGPVVQLTNDIAHGTLYVVDVNGRVVATMKR